MIIALLCGRENSKGLPGKNIYPVLGRPLMWYPLQSAMHSKYIDKIYFSTDSEKMLQYSKSIAGDINYIRRPVELATDDALLEDVLLHAYDNIVCDSGIPDLLVILLCNAATVSVLNIDKGIEALLKDENLDSAVTVALMNQYSPVRAKIITDGKLFPAIKLELFNGEVSCDRRCMGNVYFCDASLWVIRPRCMDYGKGQLPFRWMGKNIFPIIQQGGLDVDDADGIYLTEIWLKKNGFSSSDSPYDIK